MARYRHRYRTLRDDELDEEMRGVRYEERAGQWIALDSNRSWMGSIARAQSREECQDIARVKLRDFIEHSVTSCAYRGP